MEVRMAEALSSVFARAKYCAILNGVGPRRDRLLASEYSTAVWEVVQGIPPGANICLEWVHGPESDPQFYASADLSCMREGWKVVCAALHVGGFVWVVTNGMRGVPSEQWTAIYQFECKLDDVGYNNKWVAVGAGLPIMDFGVSTFGPEKFAVELTKKLAERTVELALSMDVK
jgi:hypothetical protein